MVLERGICDFQAILQIISIIFNLTVRKMAIRTAHQRLILKVQKIENFLDSDLGICVISLLVMSKY